MATTFLDSGGEHSSLNKRLNAEGKTMFFASSGHEPPACCHPTEQSFVDDDFQRQNPAAPRPHRPCYSEYLHPTNGQDKPTEDAFQLGSYTATEKSFSSGYGTTAEGTISGTLLEEHCDPLTLTPVFRPRQDFLKTKEKEGKAETKADTERMEYATEYSTIYDEVDHHRSGSLRRPDFKPSSSCSNRRIIILIVVGIVAVAAIAVPLGIVLPLVLEDKEYSPPNVTVEVDGVTAAHVGDHVTVWCRVSNIHTLSSIDFLYNRSVVASFSIRTENVSNLHPRFTLALLKEHDGYSLNLTLTNVTCSDAGRYTCLARDERKDVEKWTRLSVMTPSVPPTLEVPRLVDGLINEPPVCRIASMGHSSVTSISWLLKSPNHSSESELEPELHQDTVCYNDSTCIAQGTSRLNIQIHVEWNNHHLCCRMQDILQTDYIAMETCQTLTVLPLVEVTQGLLATIGESVNITCTIRDMNVTEVTFLSGGEVLLTFDITNSSIVSNRTNVIMYVNRSDVTEWQAILSLSNVECSDGGSYTCRVARGNDSNNNASTTLRVRRPPHTPSLTIPPIAETHTIQKPTCRAGNLGYNSAMAFRWTLRPQSGTETTFDASRHTQEIKEDKQSCITSGNSSLDGQRYREDFWNNSRLCCQLVDPQTGQVVTQACGQVYTIPADFCSTGTNELRYYPYEPCNTYVHCDLGTGVVFFNYCNNGLCFDPVTMQCTLSTSKATTATTVSQLIKQ